MSKTTDVVSVLSYLSTLDDGIKYAEEHDESFEFLVALTVAASRISNKNPGAAQRLTKAIDAVHSALSRVTH